MRRLVSGLLFTAFVGAGSPARSATGLREQLGPLLSATGGEPIAARLKAVSTVLLGSPYLHSPLGEGQDPDPDPRIRFDAFDCLTFVETVMALAAAHSLDEASVLLDDVRYGEGRPSFEARNHFVEAQWLPRNLEKGWLKPAAASVAGPHVAVVSKAFGPAFFAWRSHPELLPLAPQAVPAGTYGLELVPLDIARAHPERFREGQLVFVVRTDAKRQPSRVTHAGLVFVTPQGPVLRHASRDPYRRVVDEPLARFLARNAAYDLWPVVGLAVYDILVPRERVSRLAATAQSHRD